MYDMYDIQKALTIGFILEWFDDTDEGYELAKDCFTAYVAYLEERHGVTATMLDYRTKAIIDLGDNTALDDDDIYFIESWIEEHVR